MNLQASTVVNMYFCVKCDSYVEGYCTVHIYSYRFQEMVSEENFWTKILGKTREEYFRGNPNFGTNNTGAYGHHKHNIMLDSLFNNHKNE